MTHRRRHERYPVTLDCSWSPGSRVTDMSLGGCFVDASKLPAVGEHAEFTVRLEGVVTVIRGSVVHANRGRGFSVEFAHQDELTPARVLRFLMGVARSQVARDPR